MLCPNCESSNRDEAKFCDQCGFPLKKAETQATEKSASQDDSHEAAGQGVDGQSQGDDSETLVVRQGSIGVEVATEPDEMNDDARQADAPGMRENDQESACDRVGIELEAPRIDLAGFDRPSDEFAECVVGDYKQPVLEVHDGETVEIGSVEGTAAHRGKVFIAALTGENAKTTKTGLAIAAAVAALVVIAAFTTYQMGVWGGRPIPNVVGMTEADAKSVLADYGFLTRSQQVKSDDTEGIVIIMDPPAGTRVEEKSEVIVHISIGRTVPDVLGKSEADARKALSDEGLENVEVKKESSDKPEGTVIGTKPEAGASAKSSTAITLTLAQPFTVPDVSGMGVDDAISTIQDAGFTCDVTYISTDSYEPGTVIGTEPSVGSTVHKGDYILIQVSQSWSDMLVENASSYLAEGNTVNLEGATFVIDSLDSVVYGGDNSVSFTVRAHEVLDLIGHPIKISPTETITGTLLFSDDGEVLGTA